MADSGGQTPAIAPLALRDTFPPVSTADWDALVGKDLEDADARQRLVWHTGEGIAIEPYYRSEDLAGLNGQVHAVPGSSPSVRGDTTPWQAVEAPVWAPDAVRADLLHDAGGTAVQELAWAIAEGVDRLADAVTATGSAEQVARQLEFVFAVGSTYFIEIAKLRAARLLWAAAVRAFEPASASAGVMRLHVRTARSNKGTWDPYTNLLRATTEAMAAAIGGADTLLVEPHGYEPHLAINVQRILAEEAHLDAVADPAGGSYYIEAITDALAREAWLQLQAIEAAGGYAASVRAGHLAAALEASRAVRQQAVASRRRTLVGTNDYPDLTASQPSGGPFPAAEGAGPLAPLSLAAPFEAMRARTGRHATATGRTPLVHLLTRGDVFMRGARANFCLNVFGCAGFGITQGDTLPAAADLIVLCSADDQYLALAHEVVPIATVPVIVAGHPNAHVERLTAAGVQGFVHAGSDAVRLLTHWQDRLGMAP